MTSAGSSRLAAACDGLASGVLRHIRTDLLTPSGSVMGRDFYGGAFTLWLAELVGDADGLQPLEASVVAAPDPVGGRYHTEFVLFALGMRARHSGRPEHLEQFRDVAGRKRFAYGRAANWRLLRAYVRGMQAAPVADALRIAEVSSVLAANRGRSGFIVDQRHRPSMQYHAFSAFLLGLHARDHSRRLRAIASRSVDVLHSTALPSGEVNYLGRGAFQSFGYASCIAALALEHQHTRDRRHVDLIWRVLDLLSGEQASSGSIPLVRALPSGCAETGTTATDLPLGWWSYNNHSDYVAFTGALLAFSAKLLADAPSRAASTAAAPSPERAARAIPGARIVRRPEYVAVVSSPRAGVAGSQPFPFLEVGGSQPLPTFGGEQDASSRYAATALPLPLLNADGEAISVADSMRWRYAGRGLLGTSTAGVFRRTFRFRRGSILVDDVLVALRDLELEAVTQLTLYAAGTSQVDEHTVRTAGGLELRTSVPLALGAATAWSPGGPLVVYRGPGTVLRRGRRLHLRTEVIAS